MFKNKNFMFKIKNDYRKIAGFTLIELLTTIGIVAVITTIGTVSLVNYRSPKTLTMEADKIVAILKDTQNRSMIQENSKPWGVYFKNPATCVGSGCCTCCSCCYGYGCTWTYYNGYYSLFASSTYSGSNVISSTTLNSAVKFLDPVPNAATSVAFASITGKPDAAKTIKIALKANTSVYITITIDAYGKIQY